MESLRAEFTEIWTPSAVVPLIRWAHRVRAIAATGIDLLGLPGVEPPARLIDHLRTFDSIVSWYGSNRPEFREAAAALKLPFEFQEALPGKNNRVYCADFFLGQVGGREGARPRIDCGTVQRGGFAVIHPFSGSERKNWPLLRYRDLAERLPLPVKWCAGAEEDLTDAVRIPDLYQLGCWLAAASVYIGNDSGITHLAAAFGVPMTAIFGATDPAVWAPRGERVRIVTGKLQEITVEMVLRAVESLL